MTKQTESTVTRLHGGSELVRDIETFINTYAKFTDESYSLPIALWIIATYCFPCFDAFPYMVITAETKRSGKTRLAELISFACSNPRFMTSITPSTMFNMIEAEAPTIFFDEAETLSSESQNSMTQVLNAGYRKGQTIPRMVGKEQWKEFKVYSPKVFILIGDVRDTLRDRSVIIKMRRAGAGEMQTRFVYEIVKNHGRELRERASAIVEANVAEISSQYMTSTGFRFLSDRDEEIWTPLFVLCQMLCPERMDQLTRVAVDIATEKTVEKKSYRDMEDDDAEKNAQDEEFNVRLLQDLYAVMGGKNISSQDAVDRLQAIPTSPWRKYRGVGITMHNIADILDVMHIDPKPIRVGKKVFKGYKIEQVREAMKRAGLK
jgi:hypothetical protein